MHWLEQCSVDPQGKFATHQREDIIQLCNMCIKSIIFQQVIQRTNFKPLCWAPFLVKGKQILQGLICSLAGCTGWACCCCQLEIQCYTLPPTFLFPSSLLTSMPKRGTSFPFLFPSNAQQSRHTNCGCPLCWVWWAHVHWDGSTGERGLLCEGKLCPTGQQLLPMLGTHVCVQLQRVYSSLLQSQEEEINIQVL